MSTEASASLAQAASETQPQAGTLTTDAPHATTDATPQAGVNTQTDETTAETTEKVSISLEEAKKLRSENQNLRKRMKEIDDAKLSELDRAKQAAEEAQTRAQAVQARLVKYEVAEAARKLGVVNPDLVHKLVKDDLTVDDEGMPTNAEALIRALVKDNPYLVNAQAVNGSATNPARGEHGGLPIFTHAQIADFAFYNKNKAAITAAMKDGRIIG